MPRQYDIKQLIVTHNRRLQKLKEQKAFYGLQIPPHILLEIENLEAEIEQLQTELKEKKDEGENSPIKKYTYVKIISIFATVVIVFLAIVAFIPEIRQVIGVNQAMCAFLPTKELVVSDTPIVYNDFDDENKTKINWLIANEVGSNITNLTEVKNGKYIWTAKVKNDSLVLRPLFINKVSKVSDFILEIDIKKISGPDDMYYGLTFRRQGRFIFYEFHLSDNQFFVVKKRTEQGWEDLINYTRNTDIKPNASNHLKIIANGCELSFYINDVLAGEVMDEQIRDGQIELSQVLYANQEGILEIDNFKLFIPRSQD